MRGIKMDFENNTIIVASRVARKIEDPNTPESKQLIHLKTAFPEMKVVIHHIKRNRNQEHYKGLTYDFMEQYILNHEPKETRKQVYREYLDLKEIAECHSVARRYPVIKSWFLERYQEIVEFGVIGEELLEASSEDLFSDDENEELVLENQSDYLERGENYDK